MSRSRSQAMPTCSGERCAACRVMDKIAAGLRLQNKRNAFLFNAQQDIAPLFAAFVSDGNDDGGGDYATLHVCLLLPRKE